MIGSRTPPPAAVEFTYELSYRLREPIVAGLAPGIDEAAHRGALDAGVPTVAFVGYGFGRTDPPELRELEDAIVAAGGAVATLLPPGTKVSARRRIERDRLQAEQARAVVLVCSEIGGGAMYTMRFARELGKPRYAVQPPPHCNDPVWEGNRRCIAGGATALPFNVDEALAMLWRSAQGVHRG